MLLLADADATAVPAGHALAVDRALFSARVAARLEAEPRITIHREEVTTLEASAADLTILASGPLTSKPLTDALQAITGADHLAFYDSISPIVDASTIDMEQVLLCRAVGQGHGGLHQLPVYQRGVRRVHRRAGDGGKDRGKGWEQLPDGGRRQAPGKLQYFEGCLPIEETARRGGIRCASAR